ncbi:MAG: T9SS type A sorting domain-containing protein [Chlorobi bacterium]|nr:T9SS type A sorting domain-containing protein [Chlorobiota bacterium]
MRNFSLILFMVFSMALFSQSVVINEFCAKNNNVATDGDFNQFVDWIELNNTGSSSFDISGFYLTDDTLKKTKWQFPQNSSISANGYLLVWADKRDTVISQFHTNFKLGSKNEWVALYDTDTVLVDAIEYPDQMADISFGKAVNGHAYFSPPTPGAANNSTAYPISERENPPVFSLPSGFYISNTELVISDIPTGSIVRYTTDGSYPGENSVVYSSPITLTGNTVVRAKTYGGLLPGKEVSASYFIDNSKQLPLVSLIISPDFLWSDSIGIFNDLEIVKRIEWERASKLQYFKGNALEFETNNNIRLFGSTAYEIPQKSFAVFANSTIHHQIFEGKKLSDFDAFVMRSSSDDWYMTMFRDGFVQSIIPQKLNIDYQAYQPTVLYINGEYYGIFNLREKYNEDYLKNVHEVDKDSIDLLKLNYWGMNVEVIAGSDEKYFEMLSYLNNNDMTDNTVFAGVSDYLDIDNYTEYIIMQIYVGNRSYKHNIKAWRENNIADGFKWWLFDMDRAYMDSWRQIFLMIYEADPVLKKLLENTDYRNHFLQQTCSHINVTFRKSYVDKLIDSLQGRIETEMPLHIEKWGPEGGVQSMEDWYTAIQVMTDFANERKDTLLYRLDSVFDLSGRVSVQLKKTSPQGGDVYFEGVLIPYNDSVHTYFKDIPVHLLAKPRLGYHFVDWENISTNDSIVYTFGSDQTITARFEADCGLTLPISEDAILLKDCSPYHFENEITIEAGATLYCEPGVEIYFDEDVGFTVFGDLVFTGTEDDPIIIQGEEGIYWKYIKSSNGNIQLKYVDVYSGKKAIQFASAGNLLVKNCVFYESGMDNSDLISCEGSQVVFADNVFYGNPANTKKDAIDCGSLVSGEFNGNVFYDVTDDCIDIGNNSSNVSIERNEMYDCQSMGVSIGESTVATISGNIIAHCQGGIQVHTDGVVAIINNTLFDNEIGIKCYHYDATPNSGGTANVVNTIISQCLEDYALQPNSQIDITYSLSDKALLPGLGNIHDSPDFVNSTADDFHLMANSPCIDSGDILSPPDPDGTRADMGALFFSQGNFIPETDNAILVFPNPFNNKFAVRLDSSSRIDQIRIFNLLGELIYTRKGINEDTYIVEMKSRGLLLVLVSDNRGNTYSIKLISN